MVQQNGQSNNRNGYVYSPVVDAPYAMHPETDDVPYPPCPSDYEPAPAPKPDTPGWQDELAPLTHTLKWVDGDRHEHNLTIRADDLDTLLIQLRTVKCFIAASKARADVQTESCPERPAQPEPEVAPTEPTERTRVWCEKHSTWSHLRQKNGQRWYSHKSADGWCRRGAK